MNATAASVRLDGGWDEHRGAQGMLWFIATEAMLFVSLFFGYFLLGSQQAAWPMDAPPKLGYALAMLAVLLLSSGVVEWARRQGRRGREGPARVGVIVTVALGLVFLFLQGLEYREHLRTLKPTDDAYASLFYTITSVHGFHVVLGVLMLAYVSCLPRLGPGGDRPPHRPLHSVSMYWHFVDAAWVVIVALLYVLPNLGAR